MSLEDRFAILDVIGRYSQAWDAKDADAYAGCFAEDGIVEVYTPAREEPVQRHVGRAAIHAWAHRRLTGGLASVRTRHHQTGVVFLDLTPEAARTRSTLLETHVRPEDRAPRPMFTGVYQDRWRKTAEGWRLTLREVRLDVG